MKFQKKRKNVHRNGFQGIFEYTYILHNNHELSKIENGFDMSCVVIELKNSVIIFHPFCLNKLSLVVTSTQKCNADQLIAM